MQALKLRSVHLSCKVFYSNSNCNKHILSKIFSKLPVSKAMNMLNETTRYLSAIQCVKKKHLEIRWSLIFRGCCLLLFFFIISLFIRIHFFCHVERTYIALKSSNIKVLLLNTAKCAHMSHLCVVCLSG